MSLMSQSLAAPKILMPHYLQSAPAGVPECFLFESMKGDSCHISRDANL